MPGAVAAVGLFLKSTTIFAIFAKTVLVNYALGQIGKALAPKGPRTQAPPVNVSIRGSIENRQLIFGRRRVGGVFLFYGTSSSAGAVKDYLWYVIAYAGHQVCAITDIWIDTERIANSSINAGTGDVTSGKFSGQVKVFKYLGTSAQIADANLDSAFSEWTSSHHLKGIAYVIVRMTRSESVFPNGAPHSISALIDGALVYDPRLDTTNGGSGSQRYADPSTWTNSYPGIANSALIWRWYMTGGSVINDLTSCQIMYGLRESNTRINDTYVRAAANICDESISGANAPPSGAQTRYECNLEATTGQEHREVLTDILATMAGTQTHVNGKHRVYAGDYDSPLHTLTQDDIRGEIEVQDTSPHQDRYNKVSAIFFDDSNQYLEATSLFRTDAAYVTQDGSRELPREIHLRGCINQYRAQRLAEIELRRSRMMRTIKIKGGRDLMRIAQNETFTLSHSRWSWTSRVFRCLEREMEVDEQEGVIITITAKREDSGVWTDMVTADYTTGVSDTDEFTNDAPDAPTNLVASPGISYLKLEVTLPTYLAPGSVIEIWEYTASTPFASASPVYSGVSSVITLPKLNNQNAYYWALIRGRNGVASTTYPATTGVTGYSNGGSIYVPTGNCQTFGLNAQKVGGSFAYDSSVHSYNGYPICHVSFKCNQTNKELLIALNTDPLTSAHWNTLDYAFLCTTSGTWELRESGSTPAGGGSYTTDTRFVITYDGSDIRYYVDDLATPVRTASASSLTLYMDSSFSSPDGGVNELKFGPTTNVDLVHATGLGPNAATDIYEATVSDVDITQPDLDAVEITSVAVPEYPFVYDAVVTITGYIDHLESSGSLTFSYVNIRDVFSSVIVNNQYEQVANNTSSGADAFQASFSKEARFTVGANTAQTFYAYGCGITDSIAVSGGSTSHVRGATLKVEVIKR